jgi:hypothetical protein
MDRLLIATALLLIGTPVMAQDAVKTIAPDKLTWAANPAIPKGGQIAILTGDPTKAGDTVVQRVLFPANYEVPPHTHPYAETVTVISGELGFGMGEKMNKTGPMLGVGAFLANPAKHAHFVWTGGQPAIIQIQFTGPGGIDYINPADDPRKQ